MVITVVRLGHRPARDKRVTTHVALTARVFGADAVLVSTRDPVLERTVRNVVRRFGGSFRILTGVPWRRTLQDWNGPKVHLTMYGLPIEDVLTRIPRENLLIVIGAEKVPREVYDRSEEHTSELQSRQYLVCRLLLEKKKSNNNV